MTLKPEVESTKTKSSHLCIPVIRKPGEHWKDKTFLCPVKKYYKVLGKGLTVNDFIFLARDTNFEIVLSEVIEPQTEP